jgi:hypothetical protein
MLVKLMISIFCSSWKRLVVLMAMGLTVVNCEPNNKTVRSGVAGASRCALAELTDSQFERINAEINEFNADFAGGSTSLRLEKAERAKLQAVFLGAVLGEIVSEDQFKSLVKRNQLNKSLSYFFWDDRLQPVPSEKYLDLRNCR